MMINPPKVPGFSFVQCDEIHHYTPGDGETLVKFMASLRDVVWRFEYVELKVEIGGKSAAGPA